MLLRFSRRNGCTIRREVGRTPILWPASSTVCRVATVRSLFSDATKSAEDFFRTVKDLHENVLRPINTRLLGPLERNIHEMIPLPMVLLVGNHSSGKSTFINWATGRQIQTTGVAPTDDAFTMIAPGRKDMDQDGPAAVGDPLLGLSGLRLFGQHLVNHLYLKIRQGLLIENIMLVDTPGMIDAPAATGAGGTSDVAWRSKDRGYDFAGVVSWFAQRADVILLFQDPAKPGTTGETLTIMTTALAGHEYKTLIILNKADQFTTVHDFARAYGALCWNLSKVIPRKDLPKIYTMAVPVTSAGVQGDGKPTPLSAASQGAPTIGQGITTRGDGPAISALPEAQADLASAREEILGEVRRAPLRRVDNLVTRLYDSARLLRMHAVVLQAVKKEYSMELARVWSIVIASVGGVGGVAAGCVSMGMPEVGAVIGGVAALLTAGGTWWAQKGMRAKSRYFMDGPGMDEAFRRTHYLQLADRDEFVSQLYERARPQLQTTLRTLGILGAPAVKRADLASLDSIIKDSVPDLRRAATKAGMLYGSDHGEGAQGATGGGVLSMFADALTAWGSKQEGKGQDTASVKEVIGRKDKA